MNHLSELLNTEFGNSLTAKRAQVRNEILVRGDKIQAELAKGWSAAAIWTVLTETKEITCSYKTFVAHVRRLQSRKSSPRFATGNSNQAFLARIALARDSSSVASSDRPTFRNRSA
jgi:hypothetical protein